MAERQLTHSVNVKNPQGDVVTLEPGQNLPKWAVEKLTAEDHQAFQPVTSEEE